MGLADARDIDLREVCHAHTPALTVVTFDGDFKDAVLRGGIAVLYLRPPETTCRTRLTEHLEVVEEMLRAGRRLVTLPKHGLPYWSAPRRRLPRP